ncbi:MAG: hypothetical protein LEGION0398_MBIBDBAK_01290 [Legionellaceae bacterium]
MNKQCKFIFFLMVFFLCNPSWAIDAGTMAENILIPTHYVTTLLEKVCGLTGLGFIFSSLLQYKMHRSTPTAVPLSRCVILLLLGLLLISIPLFGYYAEILNES